MGQRNAFLERCLPSNTKIKIHAWPVRNVSMGTASLFGIQANFCLYVIWKHKSKHVKEEEKSNESWHYQTNELTQIIKWVGVPWVFNCSHLPVSPNRLCIQSTVFLQVIPCQFDYCSILGEQEHAAGVLHGSRGEFWYWQKNEYISSHFAKVADRFGIWQRLGLKDYSTIELKDS